MMSGEYHNIRFGRIIKINYSRHYSREHVLKVIFLTFVDRWTFISRSLNYQIASGYIQDKSTKNVGHVVLNMLNTTNEGISGAKTKSDTRDKDRGFQINLASKLYYSCCSNYNGIILVYQTFLPSRNWKCRTKTCYIVSCFPRTLLINVTLCNADCQFIWLVSYLLCVVN